MTEISISAIGFFLVIVGMIIALVAVIFLAAKSGSGAGKTRGAGVLLIGPFPIVFGTDRESTKTLIVLTIVLIAVVLAFTLLPSVLIGR